MALLLPTAAVAGFLAADDRPRLEPLLVFVLLMLYSEHRAVLVTANAAASTAPMIAAAAVVAFYPDRSVLGPMLVGMASALEWAVLRERRWNLVGLNVATGGLSVASAAATFGLVADVVGTGVPEVLVAATSATLVYVAVVGLIFCVGSQVTANERWSEVIIAITPSLLQQVPFILLGFFIGRLYLELGAGVMLLIVVPILIAREMFASYLRVKEAHDETVKMLIQALEKKDRYTSGHSERVARYAQYIGEEMHFGPARMERLRFAALMHDIGKLVVPNHLLNKPGKLTEDEFRRIRIHEQVSVQMLSNIEFLAPIAGAAHSDNTRFVPDDPKRPIEPYIVMIADAYDAMTSTRAYRKALPQEVAFQELRDKAGVQFHPDCVEALIRAIERRGERHGAGYEEHQEFDDAPEAGVGSAGLGDLLTSEA